MEWCEKAFPEVPWRLPLPVQTPDVEGYLCRICCAVVGFVAARDHHMVMPTQEAVLAHLAEKHPVEEGSPHA